MGRRRRFSAEFKTKVALEALSGDSTLSQLAAKYGVHPNMIGNWKKQAKENITGGFRGRDSGRKNNHEEEIRELHAKIGELTIENDFLQKAFVRR